MLAVLATPHLSTIRAATFSKRTTAIVDRKAPTIHLPRRAKKHERTGSNVDAKGLALVSIVRSSVRNPSNLLLILPADSAAELFPTLSKPEIGFRSIPTPCVPLSRRRSCPTCSQSSLDQRISLRRFRGFLKLVEFRVWN